MGVATDDDFATEFATLRMSVATVPTLDAAIDHVNRFGSGHTEAIITRDLDAARRFTHEVDAAAVVVNASTAVHRWRGVRLRRRDRHLDPEAARARPDGPARADDLQVPDMGRWTGEELSGRRRFSSVDDVVDAPADCGLPRGHRHRRGRCTSPTGSRSRCSSRARPESARRSSRRRWREVTGSRLIRLQCYEGLDESKALYEWNYKKQLLRIQADREHESDWETVEADIFAEPFLLTRPLLEAIRAEEPIVLLIDEVDRVEVETEALLLEVLSDFQVSIPELGTIVGRQRPDRAAHVEQHP